MIKDNIQVQGFPQMKSPKIKGHVKIRLYNPNTWKSEVIEGDNMVTNALADIFASNYCGALDYRKMMPLYSKMLGGVLCFQNSLDISSEGAVDDYFIPDNSVNTITAHSGQTTFSDQADDVTRGNPLSTSMVVTDGVVTLAYEWGSSAGNGTIASVALTHSDVGDAGTGSGSQAFQGFKSVINAKFGNDNEYGLTTSGYQQIRFIKDGYAYSFWNEDTTNLIIKKIPIAFKQTGLVAGNPFIDDMDSSLMESHTININALGIYSGRHPFYFFDGENVLWLLYAINQQRTVSYMTVNLTTWVTTSGTVTTDDSSVTVGHLGSDTNNGSIGTCEVLFDGTYMYLPRGYGDRTVVTASGFLKVKLPPNDSDQTTTGLTSPCKAVGGFYRPNKNHRILVADGFVINNGIAYPCATDSNWNYYSSVSAMPIVVSNNGLTSLMLQRVSGTGYYYVGVSKMYLGTKFNLPSPIQKSNSQSMVVTYTLTEVDENE